MGTQKYMQEVLITVTLNTTRLAPGDARLASLLNSIHTSRLRKMARSSVIRSSMHSRFILPLINFGSCAMVVGLNMGRRRFLNGDRSSLIIGPWFIRRVVLASWFRPALPTSLEPRTATHTSLRCPVQVSVKPSP